jgi:hypothetical protein
MHVTVRTQEVLIQNKLKLKLKLKLYIKAEGFSPKSVRLGFDKEPFGSMVL